MRNKNLLGLLVLASLVGPMTTGVTRAQDTTDRTGSGSTTTTTQQRRDDNPDWGWLGLLGLIGLAGLRRPAPTVVHHNPEVSPRTQ